MRFASLLRWWPALALGLTNALLGLWLNAPMLDRATFLARASADQLMMAGFLLRDRGVVAYTGDFTFTADAAIARVYNPANVLLLDGLRRMADGDLGWAFWILLAPFAFLSSIAMFWGLRRLGVTVLPASALTLLAMVHLRLAWCADAWGELSFECSRAGYYVGGTVALSLVFALTAVSAETQRNRRLAAAFFVAGLTAWLHPVTGYHLLAPLATTAMVLDIRAGQRLAAVAWVGRGTAFLLGALPTLLSLLRNPIYAPQHQVAGLAPQTGLGPLLAVNPTCLCHVVPLPLTGRPLLQLALGTLIGLCGAAAIGAARAIVRPALQFSARTWWFALATALVAAQVVVWSPLTPSGHLAGKLPWAVLAAGTLYGWTTWKARPAAQDWLLLCLINVAFCWTHGGSWLINAGMDLAQQPVRFFEQLRGARLVWWLMLAVAALGLSRALALGGRTRMVALGVAAVLLVSAGALVRGTARSQFAPLTSEERDLVDIADWLKGHTVPTARIAPLMSDLGPGGQQSQLLKIAAQRPMYYSYDAINLAFTKAQVLPAAAARLALLQQVRQRGLPLRQFLQDQPVDIAVVDLPLVAGQNLTILYQNGHYAAAALR